MTAIQRLKASMFLGNVFEHYDNAVFALLSPVLAPLFFPNMDPLYSLIMTYAIIPLGMLVRPIGSLFFGYIGDKQGREKALSISLIGIALVTGLMAFVPTYEKIGVFAPILLSLARVLQNFFTSGESIGGAIYLVENSPQAERNQISSYFNASTVAGVLAASAGISLLYTFDLMREGWRYLYIIGFITALFGYFLRINASNQFNNSTKIKLLSSLTSSLKTCWHYRQQVFVIGIASGFAYASYMMALVLMNGFIPLVTSIDKSIILHTNTLMLVIDFILLILLGLFTNKFRPEKIMLFAGLFCIATAMPLFWLLQDATLMTVIFVRFVLVFTGVTFFAPFHAWSQSLVPAQDRYTVVSFAYALGAQLLGGTTAVISLWLFKETNWIMSVAWYWMALALCSSLLISKYSKKLEYNVGKLG